MIKLKNDEEIKIMQEGGKILSEVLAITLGKAKSGMSLSDLDKIAQHAILERSATPSFKRVAGYKWSICACVNDVVVHGVPNDYVIAAGDIVGIDCGVYYKGFHTDAAWTIKIKNSRLSGIPQAAGQKSKIKNNEEEIDKFLKAGVTALQLATAQVKLGNYIYDISLAIQKTIEEAGYSIVTSLVGHGVGRELHEEPEIPGFVKLPRVQTPKLIPGMTLAIEVIYNMGKSRVTGSGIDGWTIKTRDGKISGLFEATVAVSSHGCIVLSPHGWDKKEFEF